MKKIKFILIILTLSILFIGCSNRQLTIKKYPNCDNNIVPNAKFVIMPRYFPGVNNIPSGDMIRIMGDTVNALYKYFPNKSIKIKKYNFEELSNNSFTYHILISGFYTINTYSSIKPIMIYRSPKYFNGFTSNGTYYYGSIGASSSTVWVPTTKKGIVILVNIDVRDYNNEQILECKMTTTSLSDFQSHDWIDDCIKKLISCKENKLNKNNDIILKNNPTYDFIIKDNKTSSVDLEYLYKECEQHNNSNSCIDLGNIYKKGLYGVKQNKKKSILFFNKACKLGNNKACTYLKTSSPSN